MSTDGCGGEELVFAGSFRDSSARQESPSRISNGRRQHITRAADPHERSTFVISPRGTPRVRLVDTSRASVSPDAGAFTERVGDIGRDGVMTAARRRRGTSFVREPIPFRRPRQHIALSGRRSRSAIGLYHARPPRLAVSKVVPTRPARRVNRGPRMLAAIHRGIERQRGDRDRAEMTRSTHELGRASRQGKMTHRSASAP